MFMNAKNRGHNLKMSVSPIFKTLSRAHSSTAHCTFCMKTGVLFQSQKAVSVIIARKLRVLTEKVAERSKEWKKVSHKSL